VVSAEQGLQQGGSGSTGSHHKRTSFCVIVHG
jgi:hypothetical protein